MKLKILLGSITVGAGVLLVSCGGRSSQTVVMPPAAQALSTAQVLAIAQVASETSDPQAVAGGALLVADADNDMSDPIPVG